MIPFMNKLSYTHYVCKHTETGLIKVYQTIKVVFPEVRGLAGRWDIEQGSWTKRCTGHCKEKISSDKKLKQTTP